MGILVMDTILRSHNGVKRCGPEDATAVLRVLTDPAVYEATSDDHSGLPEEFTVDPILATDALYVLMPSPDSVFIFNAWNTICWEVHSNVLPSERGPQAIKLTTAVREWMFNNTPCRKIVTHVPSYNRPALALAIRSGMKREGVNRLSFLKRGNLYDQIILGLCKEVDQCPQ